MSTPVSFNFQLKFFLIYEVDYHQKNFRITFSIVIKIDQLLNYSVLFNCYFSNLAVFCIILVPPTEYFELPLMSYFILQRFIK